MPLNIQHTDNPDVVRMAIALEIASHWISPTHSQYYGDEAVKVLTDKYIEVYNAILANEESHEPREYKITFGDKPEQQS